MGAPPQDGTPQPWSPVWSSTEAAARWRAAGPSPPAEDHGLLTERREYRSTFTVLRPPSRDATPELDPHAAYRVAHRHGACPSDSGGPGIWLALADLRGAIGALVYVLQWEEVRWSPSGPPSPVGGAPRPDAVGRCVVLIDARTGALSGSMYLSGSRYVSDDNPA